MFVKTAACFINMPISATPSPGDMVDKLERRRQRETSLRALNSVAEVVGLEAINLRASNEEVLALYKGLCARDISEHLDAVRSARLKFLENGGGVDLPEALLDARSSDSVERRA